MTLPITQVRWVFAFLTILLSGTAASADPVTIDTTIERGEIIVRYTGLVTAGLDIYATDGFHFQGGNAGYGNSAAANCTPCVSGQTISLSSFASLAVGTLQYRGAEYPLDSFRDQGSGSITLVAPSFELPIAAEDRAVFTSGFVIKDGVLNIRGGHSFNLLGGGLATGTFRVQPYPDGRQLYFFEELRYGFGNSSAPVPEPATVGLFAVGLITATGRLLQRRRAR